MQLQRMRDGTRRFSEYVPNFAGLNDWGFPPAHLKNAGKSLELAGFYPHTWI